MAMKALICPQCQAQLEPTEQDMKRGYAECPSCGTVIQFNEVQKVEHSGQVEISNTKQARNRIDLAQRAFSAGNYQEAYDYYTKVLEDIPDDILSLYRKGLCTVYMSTYDNLRVPEFTANFTSASKLFNKKLAELSPVTGEDQQEKDNLRMIGRRVGEDVLGLVINISSSPAFSFNRSLDDIGQENQRVDAWSELASLYLAAAEHMPPDDCEERMRTAESYVPANYEEKILTRGIAFCNRVLAHKTDKKGNKKYDHGFYVNGVKAAHFENVRSKLEEKLKNLPARLARKQSGESWIKNLEEESKRLSAERDAAKEKLDAAIEQFWANNPELHEQRKKAGRLRNVVFSWPGVFIFFFLSLIYRGWTDLYTGFIEAVGTSLIILLIILIPVSRLKKKARIKQEEFSQTVYPAEIKTLQEELADLEKKLRAKSIEATRLRKELTI